MICLITGMYSVQLYKQSNRDGLLNKTPNFSLAN